MKASDKDLERVTKAIANRRRIAVIRYLKRNHEAPVGDIAVAIRLSLKATSRHLSVLFSGGIIEKEQRSLYVFYRLAERPHRIVQSLLSLL